MRKHKFIYCLMIVVFFILIFLVYNFFNPKTDIKVFIKNNTLVEMSGLKIKSSALANDVEIAGISKKSSRKTNLIISKSFDEGNMVLYYFDKKGNKQQIYLLAYFEKGYNKNINITINSINANGVLSITIKK